MERLLTTLVGTQDSRLGGGDSFTDRLSCRFTVFLLGILALVLTTVQWLGEVPIACWCPSHFTDSHVDFTNRVCWTHNTYFLPISQDRIPKDNSRKTYISYYQWVALVLLCQAIMFYFPRPLWQIVSKKSGISVSTITDACIQYQKSVDPDTRDKVMRYMVKHLGRFLVELSRKQLMANRCKRFFYMFYGNYLFVMYLLIKLVYIANVTAQLLLMNKFLGTDYHMYGFRVLSKMAAGENWSTSDRFPRVTMCDVQIRTPGNIHNYTIQCSLPLNLFNEKIYIFIWFWFAIVFIATAGSLIIWLIALSYMPGQVSFIKNRLIALNKYSNEENDSNIANKFVRVFLRRDGLMIIRLVTKNSSDVVAAELICGLFNHFKDNRNVIQKLNSRDEYRAKKKEIKSLIQQQISRDVEIS